MSLWTFWLITGVVNFVTVKVMRERVHKTIYLNTVFLGNCSVKREAPICVVIYIFLLLQSLLERVSSEAVEAMSGYGPSQEKRER